MDTINLIMVLFGIIAVMTGGYELLKKTVVGRNVAASKPEEIAKFSKIDGITYLVEGVCAILLGFSDQIPFMQNGVVKILAVVLIVAAIIMNFVMARKMLSR